MESTGYRSLAAATVALVMLTGIHAVRSALAMVVWNIAEGQPETVIALIAFGIWAAGLLGWAMAPRLHLRRPGMGVAIGFAVAYAAGHFLRHPVLTPAFAVMTLVLWLWMIPALLGLLARVEAIEVLAPGILIGFAVQVALQAALHGLDMPMLHGFLSGAGAALLGLALIAAWRSTELTAPAATGVLFLKGWGLFALGPYIVLQLTLLSNLGRVQMITGWDLEGAATFVVLGLAAGAAAVPQASSPLVRAAAGPAAVLLAGANLIVNLAAWLAALQVLTAAVMAGALAPAPVRRPFRTYVWGTIGMLLGFALLGLFYSRNEWRELWPLMVALVALASLSRVTPVPAARTLRAVLAIVVFGALGIVYSRTSHPPPVPTAKAPAQIRILTYNIHMAFNAHGIPDPAAMATVIETVDADLVALQEVGRGWTVNGGADLAAWLRWRFPEYRLVYGAMNGDLWGNVILSRFDLRGTGAVRFPIRLRRIQRGLTWATVPAEEDLLIINAHFAHGGLEDERLAQAGDVLAFWNGRRPAVILGDFNAGPDSPSVALLRAAGLRDALAAHGLAAAFTYPSLHPSERRDYIFITDNLGSLGGAIPRATASDHLPVVATIQVR